MQQSTYIDTERGHGVRHEDLHSWAEFTALRLAWLYPGEDRSTAQAIDVAGWNALGAKREAA